MRLGTGWWLLWIVLLASNASAQHVLSVSTLEHGDWAAAVTALQQRPESTGASLHVVVVDPQGQRSACGAYQLVLDSFGSQAFRAGACDASTRATELVLVDRRPLFEAGDLVPMPRAIGIAAIEQRSGAALGGAPVPVETELRCSLALRPYLRDLLTGERVPATPDRFEVRPIGDGARIEAELDGWRVRSGAVRVRYQLVERTSGEVVLEDEVALSCGAPSASPAPQVVLGRDVIDLVPHRVFRGATMTRSPVDDHGTCGGDEGPEQWYRVVLDRPTQLGLRLVSEFDATLYVRQGTIDGPEIACRDRAARLETLQINLAAGTYFVAVDGTGSYGRYRLVSFEDPFDPRAALSTEASWVDRSAPVVRDLVPAVSQRSASCGGLEAPEHVYALRVDRTSFVALRLASGFDSALYLLSADGRKLACRSVLGWPAAIRETGLRAELAPGLYYVVVDGESGRAGPGRYELAVRELRLE
ncbi:MAG: hypothetical protein IT378_23430 [Sandaracinaceae bacterium]|nr:hypothetical protein [Sandaracinaceae bacterium]